MGRKPNWPPNLVRKPGTAEARTYYAGRWWTCGRWDVGRGEAAPAAKATHARLTARWLADPGSATRPKDECLLAELVADWMASGDGPATPNARFRAGRALELLGPHQSAPAGGFGPADLVAWRKGLADAGGMSRNTIKAYTRPVLMAYQWGEESGRVPVGHAARLWAAVARRATPGRAMVRRRPIDPRHAEKVAGRLAPKRPVLAALHRLHAVTGARVTELLALTAGMVRRSGVLRTAGGAALHLTRERVWAADLGDAHKTAGQGGERVLVFGPRAQRILAPLLRGRGAADRLLAVAGVKDAACAYRGAVRDACRGLGLPHYAPRQLRQTVADRVQERFGLEHAAAYLGHGPKGVTQRHYLTLALKKAAEAARAVG